MQATSRLSPPRIADAAMPGSPAARSRPIRLMIVDDSLVARTVMARIIAARPEFELVATASHAAQALALLKQAAVDIILLDVEMPGMDGLSALPDLLALGDGARVLMVSTSTADGAAATMRALTQGAADTLLKPAAADFAGRFADMLLERLLRIGHARRGDRTPPSRAPVRTHVAKAPSARLECVALGASTGGPHALARFFAALPAEMTAPIVVTQHLPAVFMPHFAQQLALLSSRAARVAEDDMPLRDGEILLAPGDGHMRIVRARDGLRVAIDQTPAASGCMPSVDPMLASLADAVGPGSVAAILSGMGRDGIIGAGLLAARGGQILVQDAETSVIWGMPGSIAKAGLADAMLPPDAIARRIGDRGRERADGVSAWR